MAEFTITGLATPRSFYKHKGHKVPQAKTRDSPLPIFRLSGLPQQEYVPWGPSGVWLLQASLGRLEQENKDDTMILLSNQGIFALQTAEN